MVLPQSNNEIQGKMLPKANKAKLYHQLPKTPHASTSAPMPKITFPSLTFVPIILQTQVLFRPDRRDQEHSKARVLDTTIGFSGPTFPGSAVRVRVPKKGNSWGSG